MVSGFFTRKIAQVKSVGSLLEERRVSLGICLERVSSDTNIKQGYLEAVEKSDTERLPADVYVRGFLKTYSEYLRLNSVELLEQWDRERGIAKHLEASKNPMHPARVGQINKSRGKGFRTFKPLLPKIRFTPLVIRTGLVALVLLAGFLYLTLAVTSLTRQPVLTLDEPASDKQVDESSMVFVGATDPTARLTINDQSIFVDEQGKFRETISLKAGLNEVTIKASNKLGHTATLTRLIQANLNPLSLNKSKIDKATLSADLNTNARTDPSSGLLSASNGDSSAPVDLSLKIKDGATWISVEADGQNIFDGTLLPGAIKDFEAKKYISLTTGKAENTAITFNGSSLERLGEGVVRQIRFTPDLSIQDLRLTAVRD